ncbi:tRNA 2-selenouridine(34) synthase MnmH, partial [Alphaproteobacteria bacterium]|nr:tRNA 2-selenouridine(34) synthase MnmH [Alphaproteobacteria bacterium]
ALLAELAAQGGQILDLEEAAAHRGSLLGALPNAPQPSQRLFESLLYQQLHGLSSEKPIFVESESSRIGEVQIPRDIWKKMGTASQITIETPRHARATFLMAGYDHLMHDETAIRKLISGMGLRLGADRVAHWQSLLDGRNWTMLAMDILEHHYDPAYDRSVSKHDREQIAIVRQKDCGAECLTKTAAKVFALTASIS